MAGLTPLPQTLFHNSTRLTHLEAHGLLSSFLAEAETNPAYRPDAVLTQHGPQAAGIGSGTNLTLVHLERILKGIAGERIGGVEFNYGRGPPSKKRRVEGGPDTHGQDGVNGQVSRSQADGGAAAATDVVEMADGDQQGQVAMVSRETDDWQDKEDYELAQVDETADIQGRDPADPGDDGDAASTIIAPNRSRERDTHKSLSEKDRRKQAKSDRRKQEKVKKNEELKKKAKAKS